MQNLEMGGFSAEECRFCDGLFFDDGEPEKLVCQAVIPESMLQPIYFDDSKKRVAAGQRRCPRCGETMEVWPIREVEVDICPGCRGLWLDRWELQKILAD